MDRVSARFFRAVCSTFILAKLPKVLDWLQFDLRLEGKRYLFYLGYECN
jgi:hypothetical protein